MPLYNFAYVSQSRLDDLALGTRFEIDRILQIAQVRNAAAGVTGALMFNERKFTQVLEGDESAVRDIMHSIERDPRHSDIVILATGAVPHRSFTSWSMAFAGTSEVAKAHYQQFVADRLLQKAMTGQKLCQLMLELISLDEGASRQAAIAERNGQN